MIESWVQQTSVYPPGHIYAGMPQTKQEKQAIATCEELYKFNFGKERNILGDLRATWREVEITHKLSLTKSYLPTRQEFLDKVFNEFLEAAQVAVNKMDSCFKKHQAVNEYYKNWRVGYQDIKKVALELKNSIK